MYLDNNRKRYDVVEHSKSREDTWLCLIFPQRFSRVLLRHSVFYYFLETRAMLFYILRIFYILCPCKMGPDKITNCNFVVIFKSHE